MNFSCIWSLAWKIASSLKRAFSFYYRSQLYYDECKWMIIFTRDSVHFYPVSGSICRRGKTFFFVAPLRTKSQSGSLQHKEFKNILNFSNFFRAHNLPDTDYWLEHWNAGQEIGLKLSDFPCAIAYDGKLPVFSLPSNKSSTFHFLLFFLSGTNKSGIFFLT